MRKVLLAATCAALLCSSCDLLLEKTIHGNGNVKTENRTASNTDKIKFTYGSGSLKNAKDKLKDGPYDLVLELHYDLINNLKSTPNLYYRKQPGISTEEYIVNNVENILFEFNKANLQEQSKQTLDKVVLAMLSNDKFNIELSAHSDSKGSDAYNLKLSEQRANSAKNYLLAKGISKNRLQVKGIGKSNFVAINYNPDGTDNPEGRKFNRRVDIHLLNIIIDDIVVEPINVPENLKIK